jgi:hypothetical protein
MEQDNALFSRSSDDEFDFKEDSTVDELNACFGDAGIICFCSVETKGSDFKKKGSAFEG